MLAKFCETDTDIENFLTGFETVARAYKWSEDMWVLKLIPLLTGRAMAANTNMDQEMAKDYEEVKQAILHRFDINEETYHQKFHSVRRTGTESYAELGVRPTDLFNKWTEVAEGDAKKLAEMVIQEQLVANMPQDLHAGVDSREEAIISQGGNKVG